MFVPAVCFTALHICARVCFPTAWMMSHYVRCSVRIGEYSFTIRLKAYAYQGEFPLTPLWFLSVISSARA